MFDFVLFPINVKSITLELNYSLFFFCFFCFLFMLSLLRKVPFKPTNFSRRECGEAGHTKIQMPTIYIAEGASFKVNKQAGAKK